MDKRNLVVAALVGTVVVSSTGAALSAWTGAAVERELRAGVETINQQGGLRISEFTHERGLFSAAGQFKVQSGGACGELVPGDASLLVTYHVSHVAGLAGPAQFDALVHLPSAAQGVVQMASGDDVLARVDAHAGWSGNLIADIDSPAVTVTAGAEASIKAERSHGHVSTGAHALQVDWQQPGLRVYTPLGNANLQSLAWHSTVARMDRDGGQSQVELVLGHAAVGPATLDALRLSATAHRHDGQVDVDTTYQLGSFAGVAANVRQVRLGWGLKGVDASALDVVNKTLNDSCGWQHPAAGKLEMLRAAFQRVVARGVQQDLKVSGQFDQGSVDAAVAMRLQAPPGALGGTGRLADQLTVHASLSASRQLAAGAGLPDLVKTGFATQVGELLSTTFDYAGGRARLNGRATGQSPVGDAGPLIAGALDALQHLLAGDTHETPAPAAASPVEAAAEPAPAPVALQAAAEAAPAAPASEGASASVATASH